jgi:apolipoprotein N-acyltransferase
MTCRNCLLDPPRCVNCSYVVVAVRGLILFWIYAVLGSLQYLTMLVFNLKAHPDTAFWWFVVVGMTLSWWCMSFAYVGMPVIPPFLQRWLGRNRAQV